MFPNDRVAEPTGPMPGPPALSCDRLPGVAGAIRFELAGELDLVSRPLVCDLGGVGFADLSGLRVLLDATAHATLTGSRLTVENCPPIVPRMLDLLGLTDALDIAAGHV